MNVRCLLSAFFFSVVTVPFGFCTDSPDVSHSYKNYLELLHQFPQTLGPLGNHALHEIEIVIDPIKMKEIQQETGRLVGIVHKDRYWIWINDAVQFPSGTYGVYGRIVWAKSLDGIPGVAVMPILPDGKIVLNLNFRHATRSWEFELPRGLIEKNEMPVDAAKREALEETGMVIHDVYTLGMIAPDSGLTNSLVPVFLAKVISQQQAQPEDSEAIPEIHAFSLQELKKGFLEGHINVSFQGRMRSIPLRDPFLAYAIFQAELRQLLD